MVQISEIRLTEGVAYPQHLTMAKKKDAKPWCAAGLKKIFTGKKAEFKIKGKEHKLARFVDIAVFDDPAAETVAAAQVDNLRLSLAAAAKEFDGENNTEEVRKLLADKMKSSMNAWFDQAMQPPPRSSNYESEMRVIKNVLDNFTYKPDWQFILQTVPRYLENQAGHGIVAYLRVTYKVPHSGIDPRVRRHGSPESYLVDIASTNPIHKSDARNEDMFLRWLRIVIRRGEEHEQNEFFRVNGQMVQDPHAYDHQPHMGDSLPQALPFDEMMRRRRRDPDLDRGMRMMPSLQGLNFDFTFEDEIKVGDAIYSALFPKGKLK